MGFFRGELTFDVVFIYTSEAPYRDVVETSNAYIFQKGKYEKYRHAQKLRSQKNPRSGQILCFLT